MLTHCCSCTKYKVLYLSINPTIHVSTYLSTYLSTYPKTISGRSTTNINKIPQAHPVGVGADHVGREGGGRGVDACGPGPAGRRSVRKGRMRALARPTSATSARLRYLGTHSHKKHASALWQYGARHGPAMRHRASASMRCLGRHIGSLDCSKGRCSARAV